MVWSWIAGNWKQLIGLMQAKWGKLTHNDLVGAAGERERLIGLLQEHYGYSTDRAETEFDEFAKAQMAHAVTLVEECSPSLKKG
jgi:uncharacterized protein YjbJ (UPF0337 family)